MTEKQTRCPNCTTIYKVSVTQLTVAQGMVCCPKCLNNFNALLHLQKNAAQSYTNSDVNDSITNQPQVESHVLDIFNRKVENSNIDLRTYLNNLNYFNNEPINNIPSLNLALGLNENQDHLKPKSRFYYIAWTFVNFALLSILLFQIVWFNPTLTDRYPLVNSLFIKTCSILRCDTVDQRYKKIIIHDLKVRAVDRKQTEFTGRLDNQYSKSLELPLIKVSLKVENNVTATYIITPNEYLIDSLVGIKRIPKNSPYPFKFKVNEPKNSFDQYELTVIHP